MLLLRHVRQGQRRAPDDPRAPKPHRTTARLDENGTLVVAAGAAFVEASAPLVINAGEREVTLRGGSIAVQLDDGKATLDVSSGQAAVRGLERPLVAGQRLAAAAKEASIAPSVSQSLPWLRELMQSALVPASQHAGGAHPEAARRARSRLGLSDDTGGAAAQ